jgi:drug/metabolite transporter (DMT)-like permease
MSPAAFVVLAVSVPIFLMASSLSRVYVSDGRLFILLGALALYTAGNILMVRLMRDLGLGVAISISALAQFVLVNVVAFVVFEERPTAMQVAGTTFGAVGMAMMMLPAAKG